MHEIMLQYLFLYSVHHYQDMGYHLFKKVAFCCYHRLQAAPSPGTGFFIFAAALIQTYFFLLAPRESLVLQAFLLVNVSTQDRFLWSLFKSLIHMKAHNTNDSLVTEKRKFCIRVAARMKYACSQLRIRLEAVIAAEGYFFE